MESLLAIFVLLLIGWYWLDSLRARELALGICRAACEERELQFLDQTVALRRQATQPAPEWERLDPQEAPAVVRMLDDGSGRNADALHFTPALPSSRADYRQQ